MTGSVRPTRLPLYGLFAASAISTAGNVIALLAVPWFVLDLTGSATLTGLTAAMTVLPTVISGALAGPIVDRLGHRRASIVADLGNALAIAAIPALHLMGGIELWQLIALVFVGALLDIPSGTARMSLVPELAGAAAIPLERANAVMSALQRGGQLIGPLLSGVLIASVGAPAAMWASAAAFVTAAGLLVLCVPRTRLGPELEALSYLSRLRRGLRFLREERLVRFLLLTFTVTNLLASPAFMVGVPVYAKQVLGSAVALGVLSAALGAGALAGTLAYGAVGHRLPRRATFVAAILASGVPLAVLGLTEELLVAAVVLALVGLSAAPLNPLTITIVQERTPPHMRAQVLGASIALAWVAMPVGMLAAGALADAIGIRALFIGIGLAFVLVFVAILPRSVLKELDRPSVEVARERP